MANESTYTYMSRIHTAGCPWHYTSECDDHFRDLRTVDEEAADMLAAMARRAFRDGILPAENNGNPGRSRYPTHRCPVGERVAELQDSKFAPDRQDMPWAGELYAESSDGETHYRLYFIERRPNWRPPTEAIVGAGIGSKPTDETTGWKSEDQTREIHDAMVSGVAFCNNTGYKWRRWDSN